MGNSRWVGAAGAVGIAAYWLTTGTLADVLYLLICGVSVAVAFVVVHRMPQEIRAPWYTISSAGVVILVSGVVRSVHAGISGVDRPVPSPADAIAIVGYLLLLRGEVQLIRRRSIGREPDRLLDSLIVATGVGLCVWSLVLSAYTQDPSAPVTGRLLEVVFSCLTLSLCAATVRLAVGGGARPVAYYLLAASILLTFASDFLQLLDHTGRYLNDAGLLLNPVIFVLFLAAMRHPSVRHVTDRPNADDHRLTGRRLVMLACALLIVPVVMAIQAGRDQVDVPLVVIGSVLMSSLVLARLAGLVRSNEERAIQERVLREAGEQLVGATTEYELCAGLAAGVYGLLGRSPDHRVTVALDVGTSLRVISSTGHRAERARGAVVHLDPVNRAVSRHQWFSQVASFDLPAGQTTVEASVIVFPLRFRQQRHGVLLVSGTPEPDSGQLERMTSLVLDFVLALRSLRLTHDLATERGERRFRALVENSSDMLAVIRGNRFTFLSPAVERILGYREGMLDDMEPLRLVHPFDRERAEALAATAAGHGTEALELRLRHVLGTYHWFELLVRDLAEEPEIGGLVVNAREIGDRKGAEQRLARSEARFRALVQNSTDLVVVIDEAGLLNYVSPAAETIFGYTPVELMGEPLSRLILDNDLRRLMVVGPTELSPGDSRTTEVLVRTRDAEWRTLEVTVSDLRHEPAVSGIVLNARDITERKALERDLRHQALHDDLTGLGNRALLSEAVSEALASQRQRGLVALLFIDLDDFKEVNDSLGHSVGDRVLTTVAGRLRQALRIDDLPARIGGDEFAILLRHSLGEHEVEAVAERLLEAIRRPIVIEDRELRVGASIGVAVDADRSRTAEVLLRNADVAMYMAKDRGKDRVEMFDEVLHVTVFDRLELKADLARGLTGDQLQLVYQPIYSLHTRQLVAVEALSRWQHPRRGLLSPSSFIPLAEETGHIVALGRQVLQVATLQFAEWRQRFPELAPVTMSVNLSARQLEMPGLVDEVRLALDESGLPASSLTLEITETMLLTDSDANRQRLGELRALGISIAVDDFGIGYSSLGYLHRFPFDILKIDRSFVTGLGRSDLDEQVVRTILSLARELDVRTVAEGIEDERALDILALLGCDSGQGYHLARPLRPDQVVDLLTDGQLVNLRA